MSELSTTTIAPQNLPSNLGRGALAVNRRATAEEIAVNVGLLVVCFPDKRTEEEKRIFQHLLCNDISYAAPSLYVLQAACQRLRRKFRFQQLQIADVIAALAEGKARSKRTRWLIESIPDKQNRLAADEQERQERERRRDPAQEAAKAAAEAAYRAAEEARERQKLRERIEWIWPPLHQFEYKWEDLRRLGLSGLCRPGSNMLSWAGWEELQEMKQAEVLARLDRLDAAEAETPRPPTMSEPEPVKKPMVRARARNTPAKGGRR